MPQFSNIYAGQNVGGPTVAGKARVPSANGPWRGQTQVRMQKVREGIFGMVLEAWLPFTSAIYSRFLGPRPITQPFESPVDVGIGETITRYGSMPSGSRPFPYPYMIGAVSNFMPMMDQYSMAWAWGKTPSGPGVLTPIPIPWQVTYPTLSKVTG